MKIRHMIAALSLAACVPCFVGCAVDASGDQTSDEAVAETQSALGEVGCETVAADAKTQPGVGVTTYSSSTSSTYGAATCTNQWVAEYTTQSGNEGTHILWNDTVPTTQTACLNSHLAIGAYTYNSSAWSLYDTEVSSGTWNSGTSTCSFTGGAGIYITSSQKIRLAGAAYQCGSPCFTPLYKKVKVGLTGSL